MNDHANDMAQVPALPGPDQLRPLGRVAITEARHCIDLLAELYGRALVVPIGACVTQLSDMLDDTLDRWARDQQYAEQDRDRLDARIARLEANQAQEDAKEMQAQATIAGSLARIEALEAALLSCARSTHTARKKIKDAERQGIAATLDAVTEHQNAA